MTKDPPLTSTNGNVKSNYFKDDVNVIKLKNSFDKLMEEDKVLDINDDLGKDDDIGSVLDGEVLANGNGPQEPILSDYNKSVNKEVVKVQEKGSLWSQFKE
nr:hypothetical protein [Tanacetum cinerariifolium]